MMDYDVAIVGAGPAGSATARRLAMQGRRVIVLERSVFDEPRVGESLAPAVRDPLVKLGLWTEFLALKPLPSFGTRSVWGSADVSQHSHLFSPYETGWHVDRLRFDHMLLQAAKSAGAEPKLAARIEHCAFGADGMPELIVSHCGDRTSIRARVLVDASGRKATLARSCKARHRVFDRLVGVAVLLSDPDASQHCYTHVEATEDGWWYTAPLPQHRTIVMLMSDADLVRAHRLDSEDAWRTALAKAAFTRARVGEKEPKWGPRIFSAISHRLIRSNESPTSWLAVGDAALSVDPISGSGVPRALNMAEAAADAISQTLDGDPEAIPRYEAERNRECTEYLVERASYYGYEQRWSRSPFWERRVHVLERSMAV